jgi:tRNA A37 N6-isopentenylltransferase MiaA
VVVGGSGFYLRTLLSGQRTTPRPDAAAVARVRAQLQEDRGDWDRSVARLRACDPAYAATLSRNDYYRLERGVCIPPVTRTYGRAPDRCGALASAGAGRDDGRAALPREPPRRTPRSVPRTSSLRLARATSRWLFGTDNHDYRCVFLTTARVPLMRRIDARCEQMIEAGLVEVRYGPAALQAQAPVAHRALSLSPCAFARK